MKPKIECYVGNKMFLFNTFGIKTNGNGITSIGICSKANEELYPLTFRGRPEELKRFLEDILEEINNEIGGS
jgi:hypothetical protein